jgi:hypothetical protein
VRYMIRTDAFGQPMFMGGLSDGEPVWISREFSWRFDPTTAFEILPAFTEATLELEATGEPHLASLLWGEDMEEN